MFFSVLSVVSSSSAHSRTTESFSLLESSKKEFYGNIGGGQFGSSIAHGDFTGNGSTDVFVGSPFSSSFNRQWNGAVTIIFGGEDKKTLFSMYGENSGDQLGTAITAGDFNGDGMRDLAVGAFNALVEDERPGKVYVIYGGAGDDEDLSGQLVRQVGDRTETHFGDFVSNKVDSVLSGQVDKGRFGVSMLAADINSNGIDDLIVGAEGRVYIYFGSEDGIRKHPSITVRHDIEGERFGSSLAVGDFTGSGKAELVVGAHRASYDDKDEVGKVYVFEDIAGRTGFVDSYDFYIPGFYENSRFGFDMDTGDANGNGKDDLLISSFPYNGNHRDSGVFLYYGGNGFREGVLPDVIIDDPLPGSLPGTSVLLKDFNGNGKDDIIIGSPSIKHVGGNGSGKVYILFSDDSPYKRHYRILGSNKFNIIHGETGDDWFGFGLDAFDLNGNSMNDLAVGARFSSDFSGSNVGKMVVFIGDNGPFGKNRDLFVNGISTATRGEFVKAVIDSFELETKKSGLLESCYSHKEFCFFNFIAMSSFNDIELQSDLILYPDVPPSHAYSYYINTATALGLVNGYLGLKDSPFMPDEPVTRIQALKVILGAADLVPNKYEFELTNELGGHEELLNQSSYFPDVVPSVPNMWWMPRYVNFAVENGIVSKSDYFHPDKEISAHDLNDWLIKTLTLITPVDTPKDEETQS